MASPHITLAGPWLLSAGLPIRALEGLAVAIQGTWFMLARLGTLGDAVCIFPEDDGELLRWRANILDAVGNANPIDRSRRVHLTVCRGADQDPVAVVEERLGGTLPIAREARGLLLAQMLGDREVTIRHPS
jgi:hypothetical protein